MIFQYLQKNKHFFLFFFISTLVFTVWWLAFFPALMSPDSHNQWTQSSIFRLNDWIPYLHTILIISLRLLWDSPAIVALFQIIWTSILFSWIFSYCIKRGGSKWVTYLMFLLFITSIPIAIYNLTVWKDIPFSLSLITIGFMLVRLKTEQIIWNWKDIALLTLFSIAAVQFRHNGIIYIVLLPLICSIFFFKQISNVIKFTGILLLLFLITYFALPNILKVKPMPAWFDQMYIYQATTGFYARLPDADMTQESKELIAASLPGENIAQIYDPRYMDPIIFNKHQDKNLIGSSNFWDKLTKDFFSYNLIHNFDIYITDRWDMMHSVITGRVYVISEESIVPGKQSLLPSLRIHLSQLLAWLMLYEQKPIRSIIWGTSIGLILLLITFIIGLAKKRYEMLIFSSILLVQVPVLFVFNVAGDWRYMYFIYLAIFVCIPLYTIPQNTSK